MLSYEVPCNVCRVRVACCLSRPRHAFVFTSPSPSPATLADVAGYLEKFRGSDQDFGISAEGLHAITGFGASEVAAIVKGLSPKGTGV